MNEREAIDMPVKAKDGLKQLLVQKQLVDAQFQSYVKGCFDTLNLDGDYDLDINQLVFKPRPAKSEENTK